MVSSVRLTLSSGDLARHEAELAAHLALLDWLKTSGPSYGLPSDASDIDGVQKEMLEAVYPNPVRLSFPYLHQKSEAEREGLSTGCVSTSPAGPSHLARHAVPTHLSALIRFQKDSPELPRSRERPAGVQVEAVALRRAELPVDSRPQRLPHRDGLRRSDGGCDERGWIWRRVHLSVFCLPFHSK